MSKTKVPAYLSFVADLLTRAAALECSVERDMNNVSTLPENKGFCFVYVDGGTAALIIPKSVGELKACDLHIEWEGEAGYIEAVTDRGAVICQVDPGEIDLDSLLTRLSGAKKRAKATASKKASKETLEEMKAKLAALGHKPAVIVRKPDSQAPVAEEPELEGEFSADAS